MKNWALLTGVQEEIGLRNSHDEFTIQSRNYLLHLARTDLFLFSGSKNILIKNILIKYPFWAKSWGMCWAKMLYHVTVKENGKRKMCQ